MKSYLSFILLFLIFRIIGSPQPLQINFQHLTTANGLSQSTVTCILQDKEGFMWFGTLDGLNRYDGYTFEVYRYAPDNLNSISHNTINDLMLDKLGNIWVGTEKGLNIYERKGNNFRHFRPLIDSLMLRNININSLSEDKNENIWIATKDSGLYEYNWGRSIIKHFRVSKNAIESYTLRKVLADSNNNIWVGSWDGYLNVYIPEYKKFVNPIGKCKSTIWDIVEIQRGEIWVCTKEDGLFQLIESERGNWSVTKFNRTNSNLKTENFYTIIKDRQGRLWAGSENEGLYLLNPNTKNFECFKSDIFDECSINSNSIWSAFEDTTGNLWFGTYKGGINLVYRYNTGFVHYKNIPGKQNTLSHNIVTSFCEDEKGKIWIGTDGGGMSCFDPEKNEFTRYNKENTLLLANSIQCVFEDNMGQLWVGTWRNGLYLFDRRNGREITNITSNDGLSGKSVHCIYQEKRGLLWLGTHEGGISCLDPLSKRFIDISEINQQIDNDNIWAITGNDDSILWAGGDKGLYKINLSNKKLVHHYEHIENNKNSISYGWVQALLTIDDSIIWVGTTGGLNRFNCKNEKFTGYYVKDGLPNDAIKGIEEDRHGNIWVSTNKGISVFNCATKKFTNYNTADGLQGNEFFQCSHYQSSKGVLFFGGINGFTMFDPDNLSKNPFLPPVFINRIRVLYKGSDTTQEINPNEKIIVLTSKYKFITIEFSALNYVSSENNQYAFLLEGLDKQWTYIGTQRTLTFSNLKSGKYVLKVKGSNNSGNWNEKEASIRIVVKPPWWRTPPFILAVFFIFCIIIFIVYKNTKKNRIRKIEQKRTKDLENINKAGFELTKDIKSEEKEIISILYEQVKKIPEIELNNIYLVLYDKATENLNYEIVVENEIMRKGDGEGLTSRKLNKKEKRLTDEVIILGTEQYFENHTQINEWYQQSARREAPEPLAKSFLGIPMKSGNEVVGAVCIYNLDKENAYTEQDRFMVSNLVQHAANAILNSRYYQKANKTREALSKFSSIHIKKTPGEKDILTEVYSTTNKIMGVLNMSIALYNKDNGEITFVLAIKEGENIDMEKGEGWQPRKLGQNGKTDQIIRDKKHILISTHEEYKNWYEERKIQRNVPKDRASWLGMPMLLGDEIFGVIIIYDLEKEFAYSGEDIEILKVIANLAAIYLKNEKVLNEKNSFFQAAEHEMLSPLLPLINTFSNLKKRFEIQGIKNEKLNLIADDGIMHCRHLSLTFENIDFIRSGKLELNLSEIKIFADVIIPIMEITRGFAESKNIKLSYLGHQNVSEFIVADKDRMMNVFFNLVMNAIKYSIEGNSVYIEGRSVNNKSLITIKNIGIGIPEGWEKKIFELYARADNAKIFAGNGTGIGLFVVGRIIEAHGGKIYVSQNSNPTIFTMELDEKGGKLQ